MKGGAEIELLESQLLRSAREELSPTSEQRGALRSAVLASAQLTSVLGTRSIGSEAPPPRASGIRPRAVPPAPPTGSGNPASTSGAGTHVGSGARAGSLGKATALRGQFGLKAVVLGTLGGALVGFAAGYLAFGPLLSTRTGGQTPGSVGQVAPAGSVGELGQSPALAPAGDDRPAEVLALEDLGAETRTLAPAGKHGQTKEGAAASPTLATDATSAEAAPMSFYEELTYLRRAQAALRRGESALALGLMQSLDRLDAGGALLSERGMTKVLALCLLERSEEAALVARGLTQSKDASLYRERLAKSCASSALEEEDANAHADDPSQSANGAASVATEVSAEREDRERQSEH